MSEPSKQSRSLPPRWFIRLFWVLQRAAYDGGTGLSQPWSGSTASQTAQLRRPPVNPLAAACQVQQRHSPSLPDTIAASILCTGGRRLRPATRWSRASGSKAESDW